MATYYGNLITTKSDDCIIDADALADALNKYKWCADEMKWKNEFKPLVDEFYFYPDFLKPLEVRGVKNPTIAINELKRKTSEIPLSKISAEFSPHVKQGWFQISCVFNHRKSGDYDCGKLKIHSDGRIERNLQYQTVQNVEVFP